MAEGMDATEIEYLRTFCAAVETGSMARAAVALGLSQPAVSHEIRSLESHLGVRLLDRTPEGVVPTEYGMYTYQIFAALVQRCSEVHDTLAQMRAKGQVQLAVGATPFPGGYVVPFAVRPFMLRHPDVHVDLRIAPASAVLSWVRQGAVDFAIVDVRVAAPDLVHDTLTEEPALVVVGSEHPLASADHALEIEDLLRLPHVLCADAGTSLALFALLAARALEPGHLPIATRVESLEAAKALVEDGVGVGIFPARVVRGALQAETLIPLDVQGFHLRVPILETHVRNRHLTPLAAAFVDQVRRTADEGRRRRRECAIPATLARVPAPTQA